MKDHLAPLPPPLVAPERKLSEFTVKGMILGLVLSMLLAAANAYIGLLVGIVVSASIPAAAVSMGVLRLFPKSNILENNLVQTSASAGEALAAGLIFTIPALVLMGAWQHYSYWPLFAVALIGGVLGVAFTIPLRRALIVEARLKFPEGIATAEVLKTGGIAVGEPEENEEGQAEEGAAGFRNLLRAAGIGALFKFLESGMRYLAGGVATSFSLFSGRYLFTANMTLSPALLGVGFIVGLNIAVLVFLGGFLGTIVGVPLNWAFNADRIMADAGFGAGTALASLSSADWATLAGQSWKDCRLVGVGSMIVGGVWSLIALAKPLLSGVKTSLAAYRAGSRGESVGLPRTEMDTPINYIFMVAVLAAVPLFFLFRGVLGDYEKATLIAVIMTLLMLFFGFIFSSVAGYMSGLVGSPNNPISGVTIATVIVSSLILLQLMGKEGPAATLGPIAVIFLAGLICSSAAIAGDNLQDLKCGHLIGATPWRQQVYQVLGVIAAALVIPLVLQVLDKGQGIGRPVQEGVPFLQAPQAVLMQTLAVGIFQGDIKWGYIGIGMGLAVVLIVLDKIQEKRGSSFRFPVLAVAVGVYLPVGLSIPIFVGGILAHLIMRRSRNASEKVRRTRENTGLLLASGLITGEALMGVAIAFAAAFPAALPGVLGLSAMLIVIGYLYSQTARAA